MSKYYSPVEMLKTTKHSLLDFLDLLDELRENLSAYLPKDVDVDFPGKISIRMVYCEEEPIEHRIRELLVGFIGPNADKYLQWFDDQQKEIEELRKEVNMYRNDL